MINKFTELDMKNCTYYCFFYDMININNLDQNKIKRNEKSYKIFLFITLET